MLRLDLICLTNSGISAARIVSVRPMIDSAHEAPEAGAEDGSEDAVPDTSMIALTRKYSGVMMKPPMSPRNCTQTP